MQHHEKLDAGGVFDSEFADAHALRSPSRPGPTSGGRGAAARDAASHDGGEWDPALAELAESITQRLLAGEPVDPEQLAADHPARADEVRRLVSAVRLMAELGRAEAREGIGAPSGARDAEGHRVFGDFRIVREIGRGGMAVVYEAEQEPLGRRVALKVLPLAAALDPRALQRFQLEAQVAGLLQHPRIVTVHAVGAVDEVPYYAMQYIDGGSLAELIAELRRLAKDGVAAPPAGTSPSALAAGLLSGRFAPPRREPDGDRPPSGPAASAGVDGLDAPAHRSVCSRSYLRTVARLGVQAAEALGHAHDQGIVHRDVKPANLLLDTRGELWVADFGMADVQGDAGLTLTGDLPGTLRYMSPEQALGKRSLVDRRTDIYALGATLYELATLHPAVDGADKQEILRRVAEEEPVPIRRLNPAVPVDLATMITKCLSKDPTNRYETAWQLADDLVRFLDGRPIAARPVGPHVRAWRWCRRKPVQAGLAAGLALAIVVGFVGITWNWREAVRQRGLMLVAERRAARERDEKEAQRAKADAINRFLTQKLLLQAAPEHNPKARAVTLREALDRAAGEVAPTFQGHPETEAAIRLALGQTYHELGEYTKSERHLRRAYEMLARGRHDPGPERLQTMLELGHILYHLERLDEAKAMLLRAVAESRRELGASHDTSLMATRYLAQLELRRGEEDQAEDLFRRALDDARRGLRPRCTEALNSMTDLGKLLAGRRRYDEAEHLLRASVDLKRATLGAEHPDTLTNQHTLASVLLDEGRIDEAEALARQTLETRRRVVGPEHPYTLRSLDLLAGILRARGRFDEAEAGLRTCLETQRRVLGPNHSDTLKTSANLESLLADRARPASTPAPPR
jgi:serine/threonine-protein kinase